MKTCLTEAMHALDAGATLVLARADVLDLRVWSARRLVCIMPRWKRGTSVKMREGQGTERQGKGDEREKEGGREGKAKE